MVVGAALILTGIGLALVALHAGSAGPPVLVAAAVAAGAGMGASYPLLASEPFTPTAPTTTVGPLVAFARPRAPPGSPSTRAAPTRRCACAALPRPTR